VTELDAASNNGVDTIRDLIEDFAYAPMELKTRVYIFDEVHMLSRSAFNALLKSMEEPPEHLVFILATTELHKVPATIVSRCQRFSFRRLQMTDITTQLEQIASLEKIALTPSATQALASVADGAMRDALSLLDQCASAAEGFEVDLALVQDRLGLVGTKTSTDWLLAISQGDTTQALAQFHSMYENGKEATAIFDLAASLLREVLYRHLSGESSATRIDPSTMTQLLSAFSPPRLIAMIRELLDTIARLGTTTQTILEADLCVLRLCRDPRMIANSLGDAPIQAPPQKEVAPISAAPVSVPTAPVIIPKTDLVPENPPEPEKKTEASISEDVPWDQSFEPKAIEPSPKPKPVVESPRESAQTITQEKQSPAYQKVLGAADMITQNFLKGGSVVETAEGIQVNVANEFFLNTLESLKFSQKVSEKLGVKVWVVVQPLAPELDPINKLVQTLPSDITQVLEN
jgi:DNA polymerase-3 subunit gamma/tau